MEYLFNPHAFSTPLPRLAMALEEKTQPVRYKLYTIKSYGTPEISFWVFEFPFLFTIYCGIIFIHGGQCSWEAKNFPGL